MKLTPVNHSESPFCDHIFPKSSALLKLIESSTDFVCWVLCWSRSFFVITLWWFSLVSVSEYLHLSVLIFTLDLLYLRALSPRSASCVKFKWKVLWFCWSSLYWSNFYNMCNTWFAPPSDSQPEERLLDYTCYSWFVTLLIFTYGNGADWRYMTFETCTAVLPWLPLPRTRLCFCCFYMLIILNWFWWFPWKWATTKHPNTLMFRFEWFRTEYRP